MKVALYRSFTWEIEIPDNLVEFDCDGKATNSAIFEAIAWMDANDKWPNLFDGEELNDELQITKLEDSQ